MRSSYDEKGLQRPREFSPRGLAKLAIPSGDQFRRQAVSTDEKCAELSLIDELYIDFILDKSEKVQQPRQTCNVACLGFGHFCLRWVWSFLATR